MSLSKTIAITCTVFVSLISLNSFYLNVQKVVVFNILKLGIVSIGDAMNTCFQK